MCPFFSIVIPVYNVAPYLRECLDSVLAQTFGDWEALCVDDGSTDGSSDILDEYAAKDKRFRIIHQANAGVSVARNAAINMAQGDWTGFLDSDDVWLPWLLEGIKESIDAGESSWVRMKQCACFFKEQIPSGLERKPPSSQFHHADSMEVGWWEISRQSFPFLNFYNRKLIGSTRFVKGVRFREDALFSFALAAKTCSVCLSQMEGYCRRFRDGSATYSPRRRDDTINLLRAYIGLWRTMFRKRDSTSIPYPVVSASTYWVEKDVHLWLRQCPTRTREDTREVTKLVQDLQKEGAICKALDGEFKRQLRWWLYLTTGLPWTMVAGRGNVFGKPVPILA